MPYGRSIHYLYVGGKSGFFNSSSLLPFGVQGKGRDKPLDGIFTALTVPGVLETERVLYGIMRPDIF